MAKSKTSWVNKVVKGKIVPKSRPDIPGEMTGAGGNACRCTVCKEIFSGPSAYEKHRKIAGRGDNYHRICVDPSSVGLVIGERNLWIVDQSWYDEDEAS